MRIIDADALKNAEGKDDGFDLWVSWTTIDEQPTICIRLSDSDVIQPCIEGPCRTKCIDVAPIRHGHWIDLDEDSTVACICSLCGWEGHYYEDDVRGMPYCPNCGARMEKEE